ncbi:response regulator [Dysgonomonas sp. Marseille-P4677]|uniref:hybrid sensor histidine kinase/response regulator transcription factor n=1 Tax=Dysgonomonas sp. Marseille-P4677 TaxID=2364790 RepID=UPI001913C0C5|nr:hybrid sensor histidine kinase/response regulator transcription factor [Dysgonomonas sp. Marseille-P4677]MBK5720395.1 response regulator [Dysgonomonas sp. Marseille-P4677]
MTQLHYALNKESIHLLVKSFLLLLICFSIVETTQASYSLYRGNNLDLSNNAVLSMHQDMDGYMWIGTYDGLNLYNGKSTFVYRSELNNEFSLCSNIVHNISQADRDHLWISTFLGLNKFSLKSRKVVESYPELPEARLLAADESGNTMVICKRNYISYYMPKIKNFIDIHLPGADMNNVKAFFTDGKKNFFIITADGSMKIVNVIEGTKVSDISLGSKDLNLRHGNIMNAFYEDGVIYYITADRELYLYDIANSKKTYLLNLSALIEKYGAISKVTSFKDNLFIAFRESGLMRLDMQNNDKSEPINLGVRTFCLLKDKKQDILWIGTDGRGVQMYYKRHDLFGNIMFDDLLPGTQKPIRSIYTDEFSNLWVGTKGDGIMQIKNYNLLNNKKISQSQFTSYTTKNGLSSNLVFCFLRSKYRNIIWIGTEGPGLSYYSYKDNKVKTLSGKAGTQIGRVHSICEINASTLWIATAGDGLLEVILEDNKSEFSIKSVGQYILKKGDNVCNEFHSMSYDGNSILYVGSRGGYGIAKFNIKDKQYEFVQMENAENSAIGDVLSVYKSKDSTYYIGASSGLTRMRFSDDGSITMKQFDRRNGMINDMIHGILEDLDGCIWLSTNKGLIKYNPHNDFFHNYSSSDLKVTEFSDDAYQKCLYTGRLFFGGINGLTWVEPKESNLQIDYKPDLYFFDLNISGESHTLNDYLNSKNGYLELPTSTSMFTISFVALDYINGENYEYSYILDNYNTEWTDLQKINKITFTNLPYGDYTLRVKYKSDVFDSEAKYYSLHIRRMPPWYLTSWAYMGYVSLFVLACILTINIIRKRILNKQKQIARKIKEEQKDKLLEAKLNFFTNVTHEFCTPLTVINGVSDHVERFATADNNLRKYTSVLRDNVNSLNNLIQEILDFRKMEETKFDLGNIEEVSVSDLVNKHLGWFTPIAEQKRIKVDVSISDDLVWNVDLAGFNRVLVNLISNAFKYTVEDGLVKVSSYIKDNTLELKVYNTGKGIDESMIPFIFERYHVLDNMTPGTSLISSSHGIGLSICRDIIEALQGEIKVSSVVGEFAEFVVTLPYIPVTTNNIVSSEDITNSSSNTSSILENLSAKKQPERPTILVVDDNKDIVWLISDMLSKDFDIKGAYNVEEAQKMIESQSPTLIITDIMMPDIDGMEFINRLKADKFTKHIPLIIISAKISEKEQAAGFNIGADAYLTKPFSAIVLSSVVNRLLAVKTELKDYYYSPESAYEYSDGQLIHQEDKDFMDSVTLIITDNIESENLRPEFIADKLGMNTRNLYRKFKKITSLSPNDYIKDYRFIYAAKLLIATNLTIQEIIYKVGITNKSYFYREFFKKYNMTPKEYRQKK